MRRIGIVTTSRADYGLYTPIARAVAARDGVEAAFWVTGMHLSPEFGRTVTRIEADGWPIAARVESLLSSDSEAGVALSMALTLQGFAQAFAAARPDLLLVLGDRFEMFAAASAALPYRMPIAHVHGGELSFGALDETFRHALTKMAHLHFAATQAYADRIVQMGEAPWRVRVSGAPGLDHATGARLADRLTLEARLGLALSTPPIIVTLHPETASDPEQAGLHAGLLLAALERTDRPVVITAANADAGGRAINAAVRGWAEGRAGVAVVDSLGVEGFLGLMRIGGAMVGNSSSGIIEAASFALPVVNIGARQDGRTRAANLIDAPWGAAAIDAAIARALSPAFREGLHGLVNPYGDGHAGERIAEVLATVPLDERLLIKRFHDLPGGAA